MDESGFWLAFYRPEHFTGLLMFALAFAVNIYSCRALIAKQAQ